MSSKKFLDETGLITLVANIKRELNKKIELDDTGYISSDFLPSYVDDIVEFKGMVDYVDLKNTSVGIGNDYEYVAYASNLKTFVAVRMEEDNNSITLGGVKPKVAKYYMPFYGSDNYEESIGAPHSGKIFVDTETNKTYRWSGSDLVEISSSLAIGTTEGTAYSGKDGAANRADIEAIYEGDKPLANLTIAPGWKLYMADGNEIILPDQTNLTAVYGYSATFNGLYKWTKDDSHKAPTAVAGGDWSGKALPASGVLSETLSVTGITTDRTFTAKVSAPKQGLVMVNGIIRKADTSDLDYSSASARVHFQYKCVSGATTEATPTVETLQTKLSKAATYEKRDGKAKTATGVTTSGTSYYMYAFPAVLGTLSKIVMNDATPLLDGGFTLTKMTVTDPETKKQLEYNVYTSVQRGAFSNAKLDMA